MDEPVGKLTTGAPLSIDQLIEYLPALKEIQRAQDELFGAAWPPASRYKTHHTH